MSELNKYLRSQYDITEVEYNLMLDEQDGRCAICHAEPHHERLSVDHDHKTHEIRGLLCRKCNAALGQVNDSVKILSAMIAYLQRFVRTG